MTTPGTWKTTLPCTRAEALAAADDDDAFADLPEPPTLLADEPDPARPDAWTLSAYTGARPDAGLLDRLYALAPSARRGAAVTLRLPNNDWLTISQRGLPPVRAGRFLVHTRDRAAARRPGDVAIQIEAGLAFGTGQHMTTYGCLAALDGLARHRRFRNILDIGTGSGVLALAAAKRWPRARLTATDIDPVAVRVTRANARRNAIKLGSRQGVLLAFAAIGVSDGRLTRRASYDLVLANILAGPLIALAGDIAGVLAPGGTLILAGLLREQAAAVAGAYAARGLRVETRRPRAGWPTLILTAPKRAKRGTAAARRLRGRAAARPDPSAWA